MTQLSAQLQADLQLAQQHARAGKYGAAIPLLLSVTQREPRLIAGHVMLGTALRNVGRLDQAVASLQQAQALRPDDPMVLHELALTYRFAARFDLAFEAIDRAIALNPQGHSHRAAKAELCLMQGSEKKAYEILEPALNSGVIDPNVAIVFTRIAPQLKQQQRAINLLQCAMDLPQASPMFKCNGMFAMGDLHDSLGDYEEAFKWYQRGNAAVGAVYDPALNSQAIDRMIAAWTPQALVAAANVQQRSEQPVFIVGMPRSGTSLVEQILASHPDVFGAGEQSDVPMLARQLGAEIINGLPLLTSLPPFTSAAAVSQGATAYLTRLSRMGAGAARVTDKLPLNFLHLGLIRLAFPGARVIHCIRDPLDTCISCYTRRFVGSLTFAYDLTSLGQFYRDYVRLMNHWKQALGMPILDVVYEDLISRQEPVSRGMIEFVRLPWNDACLKFNENQRQTVTASSRQVRQPIYKTAAKRFRKYDGHLGPLREALGDLAPLAESDQTDRSITT